MPDLRITNTLSTQDIVGAREDLTDIIWEIGRKQCPFQAAIRSGKCSAMYHEWESFTLAPAVTTNAHQDGEDIAFQQTPQPTRLGNRVQIFEKDIIVSDLVEIINKAGRTSELSKMLTFRSAEIKRDVEKTLLNNQIRVVGAASTAPKLAGVPNYMVTNVSKASDGNLSAGDGSSLYQVGTARTFNEAMVTQTMQSCFNSAGESPTLLLLSPPHKVVASGFNGNQNRMADAKSRTIYAAIKVYESDFGELDCVPDSFMPANFAYIFNTEHWSVCTLQAAKLATLAKTGMAEKRMLTWALTLEASNDQGSGMIADLS